jgi:hypothetical protein
MVNNAEADAIPIDAQPSSAQELKNLISCGRSIVNAVKDGET